MPPPWVFASPAAAALSLATAATAASPDASAEAADADAEAVHSLTASPAAPVAAAAPAFASTAAARALDEAPADLPSAAAAALERPVTRREVALAFAAVKRVFAASASPNGTLAAFAFGTNPTASSPEGGGRLASASGLASLLASSAVADGSTNGQVDGPADPAGDAATAAVLHAAASAGQILKGTFPAPPAPTPSALAMVVAPRGGGDQSHGRSGRSSSASSAGRPLWRLVGPEGGARAWGEAASGEGAADDVAHRPGLTKGGDRGVGSGGVGGVGGVGGGVGFLGFLEGEGGEPDAALVVSLGVLKRAGLLLRTCAAVLGLDLRTPPSLAAMKRWGGGPSGW
jgi:hypothetical protein